MDAVAARSDPLRPETSVPSWRKRAGAPPKRPTPAILAPPDPPPDNSTPTGCQPACSAHTLHGLDRSLVSQATANLCRYACRRTSRDLEGAGFINLPQNPRRAKTPTAFAGWHYTRPLLRGMSSAKWPKSNLVLQPGF